MGFLIATRSIPSSYQTIAPDVIPLLSPAGRLIWQPQYTLEVARRTQNQTIYRHRFLQCAYITHLNSTNTGFCSPSYSITTMTTADLTSIDPGARLEHISTTTVPEIDMSQVRNA